MQPLQRALSMGCVTQKWSVLLLRFRKCFDLFYEVLHLQSKPGEHLLSASLVERGKNLALFSLRLTWTTLPLVYLLVFNLRSFISRYFSVQAKFRGSASGEYVGDASQTVPALHGGWQMSQESVQRSEKLFWLFNKEIGRRMELAGELTNNPHRSCCIIQCPAPATPKRGLSL